MKRLSTPAIKHLVILNMAVGILQVRKFNDVVAKAVNITTDTKILNQKRKELVKVQKQLDTITDLVAEIFPKISIQDASRVKKGHTPSLIQQIPETTTNPETLALSMLFINFQDVIDPKMDELLKPCLAFDYHKIIVTISEEIGLQKEVGEDMYVLADDLIRQIRR